MTLKKGAELKHRGELNKEKRGRKLARSHSTKKETSNLLELRRHQCSDRCEFSKMCKFAKTCLVDLQVKFNSAKIVQWYLVIFSVC